MKVVALVAALTSLAIVGEVGAQESDPVAATPTARNLVAVAGGYGEAAEINGSIEVDIGQVWLRWTRVLGKGKPFLGGEPAAGIELTPRMTFDQRRATSGVGWHFLYEHRLRPRRSFRPVLRFGAGMVFTGEPVPVGETDYNFTLFAGVGVEIDLGSSVALQLDYRLHHISNADTGFRNPGINAHTAIVGLVKRF